MCWMSNLSAEKLNVVDISKTKRDRVTVTNERKQEVTSCLSLVVVVAIV